MKFKLKLPKLSIEDYQEKILILTEKDLHRALKCRIIENVGKFSFTFDPHEFLPKYDQVIYRDKDRNEKLLFLRNGLKIPDKFKSTTYGWISYYQNT